MMKRLICALACVLMCLSAALAEEPGVRLSLREYTLVQQGECDVTLHLLLYKDGSSAYDLRGLDIGLLDAQGREIPCTAVEYAVYPQSAIPSGGHFVPVTLRFTLAAPAQAADFAIAGVMGSQTSAPGAELCGGRVEYIVRWQDGRFVLTAWMPLEGGAAEDCFVTVLVTDAQGGYLGNAQLPAGTARRVAGAEAERTVCDVAGVSPRQLQEQGHTFGEGAYALFEGVPLNGLPGTPGGFILTGYCRVDAPAAQPLVRSIDRIDMKADGSFAIHGCLECTQPGLWQVTGVEAVTLISDDGSEAAVADYSFDIPFRVVSGDGVLPYTVEGRVQPGFAAEDFRLDVAVSPAQRLDHGPAREGGMEVGVTQDGRVTLRVQLPQQEGVSAETAFVCVLFLDLTNDVYQGAVWTYPGEGWVQDGAICLPEMTAPEGCTMDAAMVALYCTAQ